MFSSNNKSIGIDISDHTIEVVELLKNKGGFKVLNLGRVELPNGIVERGEIKDEEKLIIFVRKALSDAKPNPIIADMVVFGLPESKVYTHTFMGRNSDDESFNQAVLEEVGSNVPISSDDLLFSYKVLSKGKDGDEVLIVATSNSFVVGWKEFFEKLNIEVEIFDIESLALFRGLFGTEVEKTICLVDFGFSTTQVSIFDRNGLQYSYLSPIAGGAITREISKVSGKSEEDAEQLKRNVVLSEKGGDVSPIIKKVLDELILDIKKNFSFFEERTGKIIEELVFVGGSSLLSGIDEYLKSKFEVDVSIGGPLFSESKIPLVYVEATGLALRALDIAAYEKNPSIEPVYKKVEKKSDKTKFRKYFNFGKVGLRSMSSLPLGKSKKSKKGVSSLERQKLMLLGLLIFGLVAVPAAYIYRNSREVARLDKIQSSIKSIEENIKKQIEQTGQSKEGAQGVTPPPDEAVIIESKIQIVVTETPTGWLNVRSGPSSTYSRIGRIYPGDSFTVLMEEDDWYKIRIEEETFGWVTSEYVNKEN